MTVEVLDAPPFLLTAGDPGPFPWPPAEPPCWWVCCCPDFPGLAAEALPAGADGAPALSGADAFCALIEQRDRCPADVPGAGMPPAETVTGSAAEAGSCTDGRAEPSVDWAIPGVARPAAGPSPLLASLTGALDELTAHGPLSGSRADTTALLRAAERARALALREIAEMDAVGGHQLTGVRSSTASWLRDSRNLTDSAARSTVHLAVALRDDLPFLHQLLQTGDITVEHAAAVRDGVRGLDPDLVTDAADGLTQLATCTDPVELRKRLRDKAHAIDDRLAAHAERRARERMGLRLTDVGTHTALDGTLAGQDGATVRLAMDLADEADRAEGDKRGKAARHADVLIRWATDYLHRAHGPGDSLADDAHTVRTHLHILCSPDQLTSTSNADSQGDGEGQDQGEGLSLAELIARDLAGDQHAAAGIAGDLGSLSRQALRRLACDATLDLVTLSTGLGPIDVGRSSRTVTGRQFRALIARDRHCIVKGCRRRPAQCAAHHVRHWADGGTSDLHNLVLLCHQHHHDHHDRGHDLPHHDGHRWLTQTGWRHAPP